MKKILIVDDEQDIVESLKFVLESCGYTCYCAYNGEDGLKLAREIVPDLIILDVMMPRINGYKISRLLKFDAKYKNIPILMVTARSQEEDQRREAEYRTHNALLFRGWASCDHQLQRW